MQLMLLTFDPLRAGKVGIEESLSLIISICFTKCVLTTEILFIVAEPDDAGFSVNKR